MFVSVGKNEPRVDRKDFVRLSKNFYRSGDIKQLGMIKGQHAIPARYDMIFVIHFEIMTHI